MFDRPVEAAASEAVSEDTSREHLLNSAIPITLVVYVCMNMKGERLCIDLHCAITCLKLDV